MTEQDSQQRQSTDAAVAQPTVVRRPIHVSSVPAQQPPEDPNDPRAAAPAEAPRRAPRYDIVSLPPVKRVRAIMGGRVTRRQFLIFAGIVTAGIGLSMTQNIREAEVVMSDFRRDHERMPGGDVAVFNYAAIALYGAELSSKLPYFFDEEGSDLLARPILSTPTTIDVRSEERSMFTHLADQLVWMREQPQQVRTVITQYCAKYPQGASECQQFLTDYDAETTAMASVGGTDVQGALVTRWLTQQQERYARMLEDESLSDERVEELQRRSKIARLMPTYFSQFGYNATAVGYSQESKQSEGGFFEQAGRALRRLLP